MPSRRKEGWEVGTVGAGAGVGPPGKREQWQSGDSEKVWFLNHVTRHTLITSTLRQRTSRQETLPLNERSPSRSRSSPPAEAGFVGTEVWITGTTSFPPRRSNKSFACQMRTKKINALNIFTPQHTTIRHQHEKCNILSSESKLSSPGCQAGSQVVGV